MLLVLHGCLGVRSTFPSVRLFRRVQQESQYIFFRGAFHRSWTLEQRTATSNVLEGWVGDPPSTLVVAGCCSCRSSRRSSTCSVRRRRINHSGSGS